MSTMSRSTYREIYSKLRRTEDVEKVAEEYGLDEETVFVIYSQKVVRDATKRFFLIKKRAPWLVSLWKKGDTFVQLSEKERYPPMLLSLILAQEMGISRKQFWRIVRGEVKGPDERLRAELADARRADIFYSPEANEEQERRGRWGEERLHCMLDHLGVEYLTEAEMREKQKKTPDVLLKSPIVVDGFRYHWFESKALFGDDVEFRKHLKKQLIPYLRMFGTGAVVYWFGYLEDLEVPRGLRVLDGEELKALLERREV